MLPRLASILPCPKRLLPHTAIAEHGKLCAQVKYILGLSVPRKDTLVPQITVLIQNIDQFQWRVFLVGHTCCLFILKSIGCVAPNRCAPAAQALPASPVRACKPQFVLSGIRCALIVAVHDAAQMAISWLAILQTLKYFSNNYK